MGKRRQLGLVLACCLLATACSRLVSVEVLPVEATPVDAPTQSYVYAADGSLIATLRFANRESVEFDDLPQILVDAVVAAEDRRFWRHEGVDARAVVRAAIANQRAGEVVQGGSTISQQLAKNRYFPEAPDTLDRKADEAVLAMELERDLGKEGILTDYLNTVYFGAGAYGIQAAARTYFRVDVTELGLAQAALLAGLIRGPESASPYEHPDRARAERRRVLDAMAAEGMITDETARATDAGPLGVVPPPPPPITRYPYFVEYVKRTLLSDPTFGRDEVARVRRLSGGGLRIHTTIDPELQAHAEASAQAFLSEPTDPEVAIAVVDHASGEVVALVGGRDFSERQFDLATQARRSPGSLYKTFAMIAALTDGMRPDDLIDSGSFVHRPDPHSQPWRVRSATSGPITLHDALVRSSNGAFARLALQLGPTRIAQQARGMGVRSDAGDNPALVLGGVQEGVSALDMAVAYGAIANAGILQPTTPVSRITDAQGDVVWTPPGDWRIAVDPAAAWLVTDALRAVVEDPRGTGRAAHLDRPAAGKTGTSQEYTDAWFAGFTPELTTAVWVGYADEELPMFGVRGVSRVSGGSWPARIWRHFMSAALADKPIRDFPYPEHLAETVLVDPTSGGLANEWCPVTEEMTGLPQELPNFVCPLHGPPEPDPTPEPSEQPSAEPDEEGTPGPDDSPTPTPDGDEPSPEPTATATPTASPTPTATTTPTPSATGDTD